MKDRLFQLVLKLLFIRNAMEQAQVEILVIEMQMGSRPAFDRLCRHFHSGLLRFSYKICHNEQLASDAVQNSWLKIANSIKSLNDPRAFKSWLYQLVRWQTLDLIRKTKRDKVSFTTEQVDSAVDVQADIKFEQPNDELLSALAKLSSMDRQAVHLFYLEEMTLTEIATVLDIAQGTVKSRLNRARNGLRKILVSSQENTDEY